MEGLAHYGVIEPWKKSVCCQVEASASGLYTRPEESYRVYECNREASIIWRAWPTMGLLRHGKKKSVCCQVDVSASGLYTRPEESCRVYECNREATIIWRAWPTMGLLRHGGGKKKCVLSGRGPCVGAVHSPRGVLSSVRV